MTQENKPTKKGSKNAENKSASDKRRSVKKKDNVNELMTRVIIRQLPPTMTEQQFLEDVSPLPEFHDYYYVNGDLSLGEFAYSRAYFKFKNFDEMLIFKDKFDDYVFMDSKGNEFPAIVEYAPLQKMPRRSGDAKQTKQDIKINTIENDSDYIVFVEELKNSSASSPPPYSADTLLEEIENRGSKDNDGQLTPLLEYIFKKREEKFKLKEEKKRKKEEVKKKKAEEKKQNNNNNNNKEAGIKAKEQTPQIKRRQGGKVSEKKDEKKSKQEATYIIKVKGEESKNANPNKTVKPSNEPISGSYVDGRKAGKSEATSNTESRNEKAKARIRNKDRPAREIYRPGSKAKVSQSNTLSSELEAETTSTQLAKPSTSKNPATNSGETQKQPTNDISVGPSDNGDGPDIVASSSGRKPKQHSYPKFKNRVFTRTNK